MSFLSDASLAMIPSGYKDGTLYSAKPTNGDGDFTFSRGSNLAATRVNSDGLIEKGRENLLLQSNTFNQSWVNTRSTESSGHSGYDGSSDAWKLEEDNNNGTHKIVQSITQTGVVTASVYAKAAERSGVQFIIESGGSYAGVNFDLTDGSVQSSPAVTFTLIDAESTSIGSGWYRLRFAANVTSSASFSIYTLNASFNTSYQGTEGEGVYIQDAQLEAGLVATEVIETGASTAQAGILEDMPRLDYSGGATCPSLLLEPQRSNVVTSSEHIGSFSVANLSVSYNNAISPEGVQNATLVTGDSGTSTKVVNFNPASNGAYTISVFAKYNTHQWIQLGMGGVATYANFDIQNGEVGGTNGTSDIEDYGNGWYRCSVQMTTGTPISHYIGMVDSSSSVRLATSSSTNSFWAYGMQSELGSYSTSYIPTYGTSTSRSADTCSLTNASNLIGQSEGTIYIEFDNNQLSTYPNEYIYQIVDGSTELWIRKESGGSGFTARLIVSGSTIWTIGIIPPDGLTKIATAYKSGDSVIYMNGTIVGSVNTSTYSGSSFDTLNFFRTTLKPELLLNQALLFKTRLTNDELAELTTI